MKLFKEGLVRIDCGSAFHNFEAEYEKERSYNAVRDLGTERSPFSDDLKERVWVSDTGLSRPDIYAGAKLFSAIYVNTALLYIKRLGTESHSSLSNMIVEGVIKSALKMIRAARFCNLERYLSQFKATKAQSRLCQCTRSLACDFDKENVLKSIMWKRQRM